MLRNTARTWRDIPQPAKSPEEECPRSLHRRKLDVLRRAGFDGTNLRGDVAGVWFRKRRGTANPQAQLQEGVGGVRCFRSVAGRSLGSRFRQLVAETLRVPAHEDAHQPSSPLVHCRDPTLGGFVFGRRRVISPLDFHDHLEAALELMYLALPSDLLRTKNVNASTLRTLNNRIMKPEYAGLAKSLGFKMITEAWQGQAADPSVRNNPAGASIVTHIGLASYP